MATLKEHQAAMVDLLANGSGIPASASRLAHAMHDVIQELLGEVPVERLLLAKLREDATTPGLNDKAISKREKALKTDSPAKWPTPAEQRVKELENTIRQLKANNAKLKRELEHARKLFESGFKRCEQTPLLPEQSGVRKEDTQCLHTPFRGNDGSTYCADCGEEL